MKPYYLHIGTARCGSTLIQNVLALPELRGALAERGVHYDTRVFDATRDLTTLEEPSAQRTAELRATLFEGHLTSPLKAVFSTQETLIGLSGIPDPDRTLDRRIDLIRALLSGFDAHVILVLRRQDRFVESLYSIAVRRGETRTFDAFLADMDPARLNWLRTVEALAAAFGRENVHVVPLEAAALAPTGVTSVVEAVVRAMGIDSITINGDSLPLINPSLAPDGLEVLRHANGVLSANDAAALSEYMTKAFAKPHAAEHGLFAPEARTTWMTRFSDTNARLFEAFMPGCDRTAW